MVSCVGFGVRSRLTDCDSGRALDLSGPQLHPSAIKVLLKCCKAHGNVPNTQGMFNK